MTQAEPSVRRQTVPIEGAELELYRNDLSDQRAPIICAAHPAEVFTAATAQLLSGIALAQLICVSPRGIGGSSPADHCTLEQMVDDLEVLRRRLKLGPWVFWGMSGGGWLAQIYAHLHPEGLKGIIVESACACFTGRLADPACVLSPFHPAWRAALAGAGILPERAHAGEVAAGDLEWIEVKGAGRVLRKINGGALLVSPGPLSPAMLRAMPVFLNFDSRIWLYEVRTPALIIAGTDDPVVPLPRVRAVHESIRGSTFVAVDRGNHVPSLEKRPEIEQAIRDFLDQMN